METKYKNYMNFGAGLRGHLTSPLKVEVVNAEIKWLRGKKHKESVS